MWREGLGCYKIVTGEVDGGSYRNHPATKEFIESPGILWTLLAMTREEMLKRNWNPKSLPKKPYRKLSLNKFVEEKVARQVNQWQSLAEQIAIIKAKGCNCKI
jgi:hypothetical protein